MSGQDSVQDFADSPPGRTLRRNKDGGGDWYSGVPRRGSVSDLTDLGTVGSNYFLDGLWEKGPRIVTAQPFGVATVGDWEVEVEVKPPVGVSDVLWVDG